MIGYSLSTIGRDMGPTKRLYLPYPSAVEVDICTHCPLGDCEDGSPACPLWRRKEAHKLIARWWAVTTIEEVGRV